MFRHGFALLSLALLACTTTESPDLDGGLTNLDATTTTGDGSGGTADGGSDAAKDSGSTTTCGDQGSTLPSASVQQAAKGIEGYWSIDDAAQGTGCANGVSLRIGYPGIQPGSAGLPDSEKNACATANGRLLPYTGTRTKACFGPFACTPPGSEVGVLVTPGTPIAGVFEFPNNGTKGKYLGTATIQSDGKLKVTLTAGAGALYVRGGAAGDCDP